MSAVVAGLFRDHTTAENVRIALVQEGFPTDRVELTSRREPGQPALGPADHPADQLEDYFEQLFPESQAQDDVRSFIDGIRQGNAVVVVQPRGDIETQRAREILNASHPLKVREHDVDKQEMEQAASPARHTVIEKLVSKKKREEDS